MVVGHLTDVSENRILQHSETRARRIFSTTFLYIHSVDPPRGETQYDFYRS
jgi:hypothetical protein